MRLHPQDVFEVGRRYKIMNPDRMRSDYGKLMYLLMDASEPAIQVRLASHSATMPVQLACPLCMVAADQLGSHQAESRNCLKSPASGRQLEFGFLDSAHTPLTARC